ADQALSHYRIHRPHFDTFSVLQERPAHCHSQIHTKKVRAPNYEPHYIKSASLFHIALLLTLTSNFLQLYLRECLKIPKEVVLAEFSFQARHLFAGVLGVRQEKVTQQGAKRR